jgi:hypothetical protein
MVRGSAQFIRNDDDWGRADILTTVPVTKEEKRVENTRRNFYTTYGAFWFVLPASLLTAGIAGTYIAAANVPSNNLYTTVRTGAYGAMIASLGVTFWQIFRYLTVSSGDSTPINKAGAKGED